MAMEKSMGEAKAARNAYAHDREMLPDERKTRGTAALCVSLVRQMVHRAAY